MADVFQNTDRMWFGTRERMQWIETPRSGANVSTSGTFAEADLINGGAFVRNSVDAHKNYAFTWGDSADRRLASVIRSYRNGSYGGGPIYFSDPMYYETNLFSQRWADPSMALGEEAPTLTGDIGTLSSTPTPPNPHGLPTTSAVYQFGSITNWTGEQDSAFHLEIPEGMELVVGAYYTATGGARIALRRNGFQRTELPQHSVSDETCMDTIIGPGGSVDVFLESGASPNGTLTIAGMIARLRPVGSGGELDGQTVTNLSPGITGNGTYATVAENLFTNPNLVGDGTWAEVRRNLVTDPSFRMGTSQGWIANIASSNVGWSGSFGRTDSSSLVASFSATSVNPQFNNNSKRLIAVPGSTYTDSIYVYSAKEISAQPGYRWRVDTTSGAEVSQEFGSDVTVPANTWTRVSFTGTAPAGAGGRMFAVYAKGTFTVGEVVYLDDFMSSNGAVLYPYFDGSTPQGSVDPDMRQRWLGTANASESVMEIELVRGLTTSNCVAGVSTKAGKPAARLIPTSGLTTSFASFPISTAARANGTFAATSHINAALPLPLDRRRGSTDVSSPQTDGPIRDNTAGAAALRQIFSAQSSYATARLWHGGTQGSGDVWWTDIGLFAGNYTGEAFSGADDPEVTGFTQPEDFRIRWSGVVDSSTSLLEIERVPGFTATNCIVGASTRGGKPAVRLIPSGASSDSYAQLSIPSVAQASGTGIGTVHLDAALTGTLSSASRRIWTSTPLTQSNQPANGAGSYPVRHTFSGLTSSYVARLFHGGSLGSGDVWWTDIGLFAGDYSGPWIDGTWTFPASGEFGFGEWFVGEGHSGCRFLGSPAVYNNDGIGGGRVSLSCDLRETGAWE